MKEKDKHNLLSIITYCERIDEYLSRINYDRETYENDLIYKDACSLLIIQIGEHTKRLSDEFTNEHDSIPWRNIMGMRDIHAHNYKNVLNHLVWKTLTEDVPYIKNYIERLLQNL